MHVTKNKDAETELTPKEGQVMLHAITYGGKTKTVIMSEEDFEASQPLLERMDQRDQNKWKTPDKRRNSK